MTTQQNEVDREQIESEIEATDGASTEWVSHRTFDKLDGEDDFEREYPWSKGTLKVPTQEQAVLWTQEIRGQISDGAYENDRRLSNRGFEKFTQAHVVVDESVDKPQLNINVLGDVETLVLSRDLTEYEGQVGRMLAKVKATVNPDYTVEELEQDLGELEQATREA